MRVLLQNAETKLYFIETGEWTEDPTKASDFEEVERAAHVYHARNLAYAQIVVEGPAQQDRQVLEDLLKYVQSNS